MPTRRIEKVARAIRNTVSDVIQTRLNDPRIQGIITVTRVDAAPDLRSARVYLSIMGVDPKQQELSLRGIKHAQGFIQTALAKKLTMKSCPTLASYIDDSLKRGFDVVQLINQVTAELAASSQQDAPQPTTTPKENEHEGQ